MYEKLGCFIEGEWRTTNEYAPRKDLMISAARRDLNPLYAICELIDNSIDRKAILLQNKKNEDEEIKEDIITSLRGGSKKMKNPNIYLFQYKKH